MKVTTSERHSCKALRRQESAAKSMAMTPFSSLCISAFQANRQSSHALPAKSIVTSSTIFQLFCPSDPAHWPLIINWFNAETCHIVALLSSFPALGLQGSWTILDPSSAGLVELQLATNIVKRNPSMMTPDLDTPCGLNRIFSNPGCSSTFGP